MRRTLQYVACDCCGNPGEACDTVAVSRKASGFVKSGTLDICPWCENRGHKQPCALYLRREVRSEKRHIQESWQRRSKEADKDG